MKTVLNALLGGQTAERLLLHLYHYGEIYASAVARDYRVSPTQFLRLLDKLEDAGIVISRQAGRSRLYQFNPKSPYVGPLKELLRIAYDGSPLQSRSADLAVRARKRLRR